MNYLTQRERTRTARSTDAPESPVSPSGSATWEVLDTVLGREQFLVGPSPRDPDAEAMAVLPPGAKILAPVGPAPDELEPQVSFEGWRVALWSADPDGNRYTDVGTPSYVQPVFLTYVIGLVETECPQQLTWVADRLMLPLINACAAMQADRGVRPLGLAAKWQREAELILDELDIALARLPTDGLGAASESAITVSLPDGLTEGSPEALLPRDPGQWDPRLREGKMREIYEGLQANVGSTVSRGTYGVGD